jgi:hypothetical protein
MRRTVRTGPGRGKINGINLGIGNAELMRNREYWVHYGMSAFENCWKVPD